MIYVGYAEGVVEEEESETPKRVAAQSFAILKKKIRKHKGSTWVIARYAPRPRQRWTLAEICQAIEDPTELVAEEASEYVVTVSGRVQRKRRA